MRASSLIIIVLTLANKATAQRMGDVIKQQAGQGAKQGAVIATEQTANKVTDKLLGKLFPRKNKNSKSKADTAQIGTGATTASRSSENNPADRSLKTYSKFDFVAGDKVIAVEDFSQDAIGDFPDKWNTSGTGEVQTIEGKDGKWLSVKNIGCFLPEFITKLPENFTLQFTLLCSDNYSFYSGPFVLSFAAMKNPAKEFIAFSKGGLEKNSVDLWFHPQGADGSTGDNHYEIFDAGSKISYNDQTGHQFVSKDFHKRSVDIAVWRQKQRLRVYMNEEKIWDLPKAFDQTKNYDAVLFSLNQDTKATDRYLFSNIRLAVGAPDTRNKLIKEGKYSSTGILFDVNSANIKAESYGSLKSIADILTEDGSIHVKIIGHCDSDGDAALNMALSKKRAEAVKTALASEFNIDASRMETDGKGDLDPVAQNTTAEGKAQNRRVEFVKL